ncbi:putative endonuclease [Arcanobacterium pluranimalium]|uniref:YraN family protein n=1 Tax=Arcanobacterium pluranimalium TaxID=108028 RepID=UPI00195F080B|nr:YraN family protein [Arcanobacterium pluranimalium]MBM7825665.1 putative endonuclease [Arcanobacterium pluranimalium]
MLNETFYVETPLVAELLHCSRQDLGRWGESCARRYLEECDFVVHETNWRTRGGELDIIAFDPARGAIVAIEVKTRRQTATGQPEEAITPTKLRRIRALLVEWVVKTAIHPNRLAIDSIGVRVQMQGYTLSHVKDIA